MIRKVRVAGIAAAAMIFAAAAAWGDPLQAGAGDAPTASVHFLDHAGADVEVSDLGLNDVGGSATTSDRELSADVRMAVDHLFGLADAGLPQPRSLGELVQSFADVETAGREQDCLASAVYFEARGEPIEGQLAVAEVVLNRTRSGRYPGTICEVVTQPWQFSFVRRGIIPAANRQSEAWRRAVAIARIAEIRASRLLPENVLWYHADYVSPSWGRRLARNTKIGLHIFYS
ncbi:cell wall hydrolase [Sphingosinicella terrae]|uniref:cell wall hydrolase n=1 Tax=Sphingosinicella terrae TaxID=2172047 RepID=UPI000E0CC6FC|nr:cell wall hydrolase [Sphingosinicella terrae]